MGLLNGNVAVITGAGSGMGKASVELFVAEGAKVLALDITGQEAQTAASLGDDVIAVNCDISDEAQVAAAFAQAIDAFGRIDSVLNVAGISGTPTALHELDVDDFDKVQSVNLRGTFLGVKHGVRAMLNAGHGGSIVNWSSIGATHAFPGAGAYCASKSGVLGMSRVAALDYAPAGIRVNVICPGFADTPMNANILEQMPELATKQPIGRASTAEEVAQMAVFLCSDRATSVSGAIIPVDGAWSVKVAF